MVKRPCYLDNLPPDIKTTCIPTDIKTGDTQADPKDLIFAPPHFKKEKKEKPPHNFLSRFLSNASFSTFAG
jgi:tRNA1(Val) A37 N6-methylase TrmN6